MPLLCDSAHPAKELERRIDQRRAFDVSDAILAVTSFARELSMPAH
jgi:hypothetical protein